MIQTALLFAGQGAQVVGMGQDFAEHFPAGRKWFEWANSILGYDLAELCFRGPEGQLTQTNKAQPAIFLVSWVAFELLRQEAPDFRFAAAAGLSLGEVTALTAAGAFTFEEGIRLVRQRGQFMQEACEQTKGTMAAVMGLDEEATSEVCAEAGVELANMNCPGQLVISGEVEKIDRACELAKFRGAKRAVRLSVGGAYHSRLMAGARDKLAAALKAVVIRRPSVPVIGNVTARPHVVPEAIAQSLVEQVTGLVRWEESMRYLMASGIQRFIELGPGTVLSGFLKRIDRSAEVLNVADRASLESTLKGLTRGR